MLMPDHPEDPLPEWAAESSAEHGSAPLGGVGDSPAREGPARERPAPESTAQDSSFRATLTAAQEGDKDAMNDLFAEFYPRVRQIVHRNLATDLRQGRAWLSTRFSTGDVVQEVFWSVLGDLRSFGGNNERAFIGFLAMVIRNRIIDAIRYHQAEMRDGRRGGPELDEGKHSSADESPLEAAATQERAERYQAALKDFPEREQLLLRARFEEAGTFEDLAQQLGYSHEAAARRAYYSALAKLTVRLKSEDGEVEL